jgi:lycopene cyclase domain-containing protein
MTYWLINVPFLLASAVVLGGAIALRVPPRPRALAVATGVMFFLTLVFDNAIIGFGIVDYDETLISGLRLGFAPVEDFAYTLAALLAIPALWHVLGGRAPKESR